jgi:cytochrome c oxidase subunit 4
MAYDDTKSEQHAGPSVKLYYTVFASLAVLTVVTVTVSRLHMAPAAAVVIAFMIAISKASLVAAFFMHLRYDSRALHLMCAVPALLTLVMLMALMPDVGMANGPLVAGPPETRASVIEAGRQQHGETHQSEEDKLIEEEARREEQREG